MKNEQEDTNGAGVPRQRSKEAAYDEIPGDGVPWHRADEKTFHTAAQEVVDPWDDDEVMFHGVWHVSPEFPPRMDRLKDWPEELPGAEAASPNSHQVGGMHYALKDPQPWDVIAAWGLNFFAGNALKYIARYQHKGGTDDLMKARHYLDKLIELEGGER